MNRRTFFGVMTAAVVVPTTIFAKSTSNPKMYEITFSDFRHYKTASNSYTARGIEWEKKRVVKVNHHGDGTTVMLVTKTDSPTRIYDARIPSAYLYMASRVVDLETGNVIKDRYAY